MLHHVPTAALQDRLLAEAWRVLRSGGVFVGFDAVGSLPFLLIHLGDTYNPVDPDTFDARLEIVGFADVAVERGWATVSLSRDPQSKLGGKRLQAEAVGYTMPPRDNSAGLVIFPHSLRIAICPHVKNWTSASAT